MFLFLLTYGLFLCSSFFSSFISCFCHRTVLLSLWSDPCRCPTGKEQVVEDGFQCLLSRLPPPTPQSSVMLSHGDGKSKLDVCLSSQHGWPTELLQPDVNSFLLCLLLPFGKEMAYRYSRIRKEGVH